MGRRMKLSRPLASLLTCILAVPTVAQILYGVPDMADAEALRPFLAMGALLGVGHILLRPILRLITAPLGCITFGLSGTAIDIALIYLSAYFVKELPAPEFLYAILTALVINCITAFVSSGR